MSGMNQWCTEVQCLGKPYPCEHQTAKELASVPQKCIRCDGDGRIANTPNGESWTSWAALPLNSAHAVIMGLVRPIPCPVCKGRGTVGIHCASCTCESEVSS